MSKEQKEKIPRDASWPEWYDGKTISETGFCEEFLESHSMKCIIGVKENTEKEYRQLHKGKSAVVVKKLQFTRCVF